MNSQIELKAKLDMLLDIIEMLLDDVIVDAGTHKTLRKASNNIYKASEKIT